MACRTSRASRKRSGAWGRHMALLSPQPGLLTAVNSGSCSGSTALGEGASPPPHAVPLCQGWVALCIFLSILCECESTGFWRSCQSLLEEGFSKDHSVPASLHLEHRSEWRRLLLLREGSELAPCSSWAMKLFPNVSPPPPASSEVSGVLALQNILEDGGRRGDDRQGSVSALCHCLPWGKWKGAQITAS